MMFDFGTANNTRGFIAVTPADIYTPVKSYGFDLGFTPKPEDRGGNPLKGDMITREGSFYFSVALPQGNYEITVLLGDPVGTSNTTVKAESRRLMLENVITAEKENAAFQDGTHHHSFGSYEIAKCVGEGIRKEKLPLAALLVDDLKPFDPSHPDSAADFHYAVGPVKDLAKPDVN